MKNLSLAAVLASSMSLGTIDARAQEPSKSDIPQRVATFEMSWKERDRSAISDLARSAAESLTGRELRAAAPIVEPLKNIQARRMQVAIPDAPSLEMTYLPDYDELRIVDTELASARAPERDLAQGDAMKIAHSAFDALAQRKLIDPAQYDWQKADVGFTWVGGASRAAKASERKRVEYRITLRRAINGIELANAGLRIAVHASGRVSGLRLGGVTVASKQAGQTEEPTGRGRWLEPKQSIDALRGRFERDIVAAQKGKANVAWSRIMYVMPEKERSSLVEPLYVVSYSLQTPTPEGETAVSRRKTIGFSLVDAKAPPVDLTPPTHEPAPDRTKKPEQ
ncbi:MAG: hypothetical protein FJX40_02420 [Alphaproteobacteria bacterium]|nr:hypothetical protein [Alphaproteobacteria bacterium]MBM3624836.1 hypothetical protein [Alphaproteobacteria bacterium]MBM3639909.1 hypothetical protein [Alphaproteobacteria bacterium]